MSTYHLARTMRALATFVLLVSVSACADLAPPTAPEPATLRLDSRIQCTGDVRAASVRCVVAAPPELSAGASGSATREPVSGLLRDLILGNQGGYVKLTSSNIVVTGNAVTGGVFAFDVTVKNLIAQALGTTNGSTMAPGGVRVFFASGPTMTSGTGTVDFVNPGVGFFYDGTSTFTAAGQPYFQYDALLKNGETSMAKTWKLRFDPGVLTFSFLLYVSAPVQFPNGYVTGNPYVMTLTPGQVTSSLGGTVRNAVGTNIGGTVTYSSADPSIASISTSGVVTAGSTNAFTFVNLKSGSIPNYVSTAVNVCASLPTITSGYSATGTIDATDCASSFANAGRPDASYPGDMFRIALTAGQTIDVVMSSSAFQPYILLADPLGVTEQYATQVGTVRFPDAPHIVKYSGTYIIEAGQEDIFAVAGAGAYTLTVTVGP